MDAKPLPPFMGLRPMADIDLDQRRRAICRHCMGILEGAPVHHRAIAVTVGFLVGLLSVWIGVVDVASAQGSRPSAVACDSYARNYASNSSRQGQVLRGGAVGSLIGLGLGSITGAAGVGAAIGATVGVIGGGVGRSSTADRMYNAAYQDCMSGRLR